VAEFSYNNTMHLVMQQTPFFANHGLHPRFDIQGVNNVMNFIVEDRTMWLVDIRTQLVSNLEEAQR
jgi:gluconate kinase